MGEAECSCVYGVDEAGNYGLLMRGLYCAEHAPEAWQGREELARAGYAAKQEQEELLPAWEYLVPDEQDKWRTWAECELWAP